MDQNIAADDLLLSVECQEGVNLEIDDQKGSYEDPDD